MGDQQCENVNLQAYDSRFTVSSLVADPVPSEKANTLKSFNYILNIHNLKPYERSYLFTRQASWLPKSMTPLGLIHFMSLNENRKSELEVGRLVKGGNLEVEVDDHITFSSERSVLRFSSNQIRLRRHLIALQYLQT